MSPGRIDRKHHGQETSSSHHQYDDHKTYAKETDADTGAKAKINQICGRDIGGVALSRQEIGAVLDLCNDVEITIELEQEAPKDNRVAEVLTSARQRLVDYISNLGLEKCHDLYSMMLLGRNLDYYGLCQEAVVEFKLRTNENVSVAEVVQAMKPEKIAKRRDLKNWIQLVLDLVE